MRASRPGSRSGSRIADGGEHLTTPRVYTRLRSPGGSREPDSEENQSPKFGSPAPLVGCSQPRPSGVGATCGDIHGYGQHDYARYGHTATLLPDGKVLITGGMTACVRTSCLVADKAELYDPATGTFALTSITRAAAAGAVLLANGGVAIAGFDEDSTVLLNDGRLLLVDYQGARLYDPVSGTLSPVANWLARLNTITPPVQDLRGDDGTSSFGIPSRLPTARFY